VDFGPHDEHVRREAGSYVGVGQLQCVDEPRALLPDVETGYGAQPELRLQKAAVARHVVVRVMVA